MKRFVTLLSLGAAALAAPVAAQNAATESSTTMFIDLRAGIVLPTFDIDDALKTGGSFGATFGYRLASGLVLMAEYDHGIHKSKPTEAIDIRTMHFMGKIGYALMPATDAGWEVLLNAGAGGLRFDFDDPAEDRTYFAIGVGAKIVYNINRQFGIVLSPQGHIAFSKEAEVGTSNSWLWPLTAGFRVKF